MKTLPRHETATLRHTLVSEKMGRFAKEDGNQEGRSLLSDRKADAVADADADAVAGLWDERDRLVEALRCCKCDCSARAILTDLSLKLWLLPPTECHPADCSVAPRRMGTRFDDR